MNKELYDKPYEYICQWAENRLKFTGKKVFEMVSLVPVSLMLPDFPYKEDTVRSNLNVLFMAPAGSGKSTISKELGNIAYNPLMIESTTAAALQRQLKANPVFTLIIGDFTRISKDQEIIKILEGALGEEKRVQRSTQNTNIDIDTEGVSFVCGTMQDITGYLSGGFLSRFIPVIIIHTQEEHAEIGRQVAANMGVREHNGSTREEIINFYQELYTIQFGTHEKFLEQNGRKGEKVIQRISNIHIPPEFSKEAYDTWNERVGYCNRELRGQFTWVREFQDYYRFLFAHAFLNVHHRQVENNTLIPTKEDHAVAKRLMIRTIKVKFDMLSMSQFTKNIRDMNELSNIIQNNKMSEDRKHIAQAIMNTKTGKGSGRK